jgi:hypothetical protein
MKRIALLVLLWSAGAAHADSCVDRAQAVTMNDAAKKAADAAYQKALAAKKMKPAGLRVVQIPNYDRRYLPADYKPFVVKDVDAPGGHVRVLTDIQGSCSGPMAELVQQGTKVFRVERKPKVHTKTIETCQCTYLNVGGCGVAASAQPVGHILPEGVTYAGTVTIEYSVDEILTTHAEACPPPAPPP